eukprot:1060377-Amphidinium_carterae.1
MISARSCMFVKVVVPAPVQLTESEATQLGSGHRKHNQNCRPLPLKPGLPFVPPQVPELHPKFAENAFGPIWAREICGTWAVGCSKVCLGLGSEEL